MSLHSNVIAFYFDTHIAVFFPYRGRHWFKAPSSFVETKRCTNYFLSLSLEHLIACGNSSVNCLLSSSQWKDKVWRSGAVSLVFEFSFQQSQLGHESISAFAVCNAMLSASTGCKTRCKLPWRTVRKSCCVLWPNAHCIVGWIEFFDIPALSFVFWLFPLDKFQAST